VPTHRSQKCWEDVARRCVYRNRKDPNLIPTAIRIIWSIIDKCTSTIRRAPRHETEAGRKLFGSVVSALAEGRKTGWNKWHYPMSAGHQH